MEVGWIFVFVISALKSAESGFDICYMDEADTLDDV